MDIFQCPWTKTGLLSSLPTLVCTKWMRFSNHPTNQRTIIVKHKDTKAGHGLEMHRQQQWSPEGIHSPYQRTHTHIHTHPHAYSNKARWTDTNTHKQDKQMDKRKHLIWSQTVFLLCVRIPVLRVLASGVAWRGHCGRNWGNWILCI